jgi:hypothetical protein
MSELGNLANCVMDSDLGTAGRVRGLRGKAFIGSVAFEVAVVGAMSLCPLVAPAVLPRQLAVTPPSLPTAPGGLL